MTITGTTQKRQPLKGNSAEVIHFRLRLAKNIRSVFGPRDMSWAALATRVGMTHDRLSQVINAEAPASAIELAALAKELNVTTDRLLEGCL